MTQRPVPYLEPTKPQLFTRWLIDWIPPTTESRSVDDVYDWLVARYYVPRFDKKHSFRITHIDRREVVFGGGAQGKYIPGDGLRIIAEYVARGANRRDVYGRILRATEGSYTPAEFTVDEIARVNLDYPVLPFPTADDFKDMKMLVRTY